MVTIYNILKKKHNIYRDGLYTNPHHDYRYFIFDVYFNVKWLACLRKEFGRIQRWTTITGHIKRCHCQSPVTLKYS